MTTSITITFPNLGRARGFLADTAEYAEDWEAVSSTVNGIPAARCECVEQGHDDHGDGSNRCQREIHYRVTRDGRNIDVCTGCYQDSDTVVFNYVREPKPPTESEAAVDAERERITSEINDTLYGEAARMARDADLNTGGWDLLARLERTAAAVHGWGSERPIRDAISALKTQHRRLLDARTELATLRNDLDAARMDASVQRTARDVWRSAALKRACERDKALTELTTARDVWHSAALERACERDNYKRELDELREQLDEREQDKTPPPMTINLDSIVRNRTTGQLGQVKRRTWRAGTDDYTFDVMWDSGVMGRGLPIGALELVK